MSTGSTANTSSRAPRRRNKPLLMTAAIVAVAIVVFVFASQVYTNVLWYNQLGYLKVFITENLTRIIIFAGVALISGLAIWASLFYAYKRGELQTPNPKRYQQRGPRVDADGNPLPDPYADFQEMFNQNMARYRDSVDSMRKVLLIAVPLLLGAFIGTGAMSQWETVLLFFNGESFGATDAEFGIDLGFFMFTLPFLNLLTGASNPLAATISCRYEAI